MDDIPLKKKTKLEINVILLVDFGCPISNFMHCFWGRKEKKQSPDMRTGKLVTSGVEFLPTPTNYFVKLVVTLLVKRERRKRLFQGFRTIVFIFFVIYTTFRPMCPPDFFRCLSAREPSRNFELRPLLNPWGSSVLIPLAITGYKCIVTRLQSGLNLDDCSLRSLRDQRL